MRPARGLFDMLRVLARMRVEIIILSRFFENGK